MTEYQKTEAREWARAKMRGVANAISPSFTHDLKALNEQGIRHDVRKTIECGYWGTLLVAETATTLQEYIQFTEWAVDEARGRLKMVHHASFNTLEENIEAVRLAEQAGADLALLSFPASFYPQSSDEIYEYTRAFCAATNLAVILFPVPYWNFERLHPAGFEPSLIVRIVDTIPNIVCIKAEQGMPLVTGFVQTHKLVGDRVLITFPVEDQGIPLAAVLPMQFMGTSNSDCYGSITPKTFQLIQEKKFDQAMELYWQIHPARLANAQAMQAVGGANFIHRYIWKYQSWLHGFNGGPLRHPTMRINQQQMNALRQSLIASKLEITGDPDELFFIGRNPA